MTSTSFVPSIIENSTRPLFLNNTWQEIRYFSETGLIGFNVSVAYVDVEVLRSPNVDMTFDVLVHADGLEGEYGGEDEDRPRV